MTGPTSPSFPPCVDELVARYRDLLAGVESLTVVYDAGQNSGDNHAVVEAAGIGFVGSHSQRSGGVAVTNTGREVRIRTVRSMSSSLKGGRR